MARPLRIEYPGAFYHVTSEHQWGQTYTFDKMEYQWGQTYTFDKMWIIDRSLLTLEKYDLGKAIKGSDLHN